MIGTLILWEILVFFLLFKAIFSPAWWYVRSSASFQSSFVPLSLLFSWHWVGTSWTAVKFLSGLHPGIFLPMETTLEARASTEYGLGPSPECLSQHGPFAPLATASFSSCPRPRSDSSVPAQSFSFLLFWFASLPYSKWDGSLPRVAWVLPKVQLSKNSFFSPGRSGMAESSCLGELPTAPVGRAVLWVVPQCGSWAQCPQGKLDLWASQLSNPPEHLRSVWGLWSLAELGLTLQGGTILVPDASFHILLHFQSLLQSKG